MKSALFEALRLVEYSSGRHIETAAEILMGLDLDNPNHYDELIRYIDEYWLSQGMWLHAVEPLLEVLQQKKMRLCQ